MPLNMLRLLPFEKMDGNTASKYFMKWRVEAWLCSTNPEVTDLAARGLRTEIITERRRHERFLVVWLDGAIIGTIKEDKKAGPRWPNPLRGWTALSEDVEVAIE